MTEDSPKRRLRRWTPYLLIAPLAAYYAAFWAQPVATAVLTSFRSPEGQWTLGNYAAIFRDHAFRRAVLNTTIIVAVSVTLEFVVAFALALLINLRFRGAGVFLFLAMVPMAMPHVAVGAMWSSGLATHGWMNSLLMHLGLRREVIEFLAAEGARPLMTVILVDAWQVIPFMMIILLAGMQNLDRSMSEAGYVFGGGAWSVFRKITVPLLKPSIQTALLLRIIAAIQIWLIVVMLYGFRRVPVLLEQVVFYQEQLGGATHRRIAMAYAVLVALVVSGVAALYLRLSGVRDSGGGGAMNRHMRRLARRTTLYVVVAGLAVVILTPVFFLLSLSFMSDFEAYREWPLPLWPSVSARFRLEPSEGGYLLSIRRRADGAYASLIETRDWERMAAFAENTANCAMDARELRRMGEALPPGGRADFEARRQWLANYRTFFQVTSDAGPALWRSIYTAGLTILISLVLGGMAGFAFARYAFRGKGALKVSTLFVRMFPGVSIAIPMVIILGHIGLYDNPLGLSLVYSVGQIGLTVWITASVFMGIPQEMEEAAQVFGASAGGAFWRVTLPLALPGLAACAMYAFIMAWNETIQAIVLTQLNPTFPVVVYQSLLGAQGLIHLSAAGGVVMAAPALLFTFMIRKYILRLWGGVTV